MDKKDLEDKLRFLEDQIIVLHKENDVFAKILVDKVKPVCDDFYKKKDMEVVKGYA